MDNFAPLISRLKYTGVPFLCMRASQVAALKIFRKKCNDGIYQFEKADCICGREPNKAILIACQDRHGLPVDTYLCPDCGILWSSPRMTAVSLKYFYESDYRPIYTGDNNTVHLEFENTYCYGEKIYEFVYPFLNSGLSQPVVFDIGCGAGGVLKVFAERKCQAVGCDFDKDFFEIGQQAGLKMISGDARALQEYGPADLIIACQILEHIPEPVSGLQIWAGLLKEGGYLYVEVPGILQSYKRYGDFGLFLQNAHLYHFTLRTLKWVLAKAGFSFVKEGDKKISALFRKASGPVPLAPDKDEFRRILCYLKRSERRLFLHRGWRWLRRRCLSVLRKTSVS